MTEVLMGLLVLITAVYACVTFRIAKANEQVVRAMESQGIEANRPYICITPFAKPGDQILYLRISNTGKTAATKVRLRIDRDFFQFAVRDDKYNLATLNVFKNEIDTFPPGMELNFYLGTGPTLFADKEASDISPLMFVVTASYSFFGKTVEESTTVDLCPYLRTVDSDPLIHEIKELVKVLENVKDSLRQRAG
jgi:hypothetical protein